MRIRGGGAAMADQARRGDWAYGVAIRLFPPLFVAIYVAFFVKRFYTSSGLLSAVGDPVASDFTMFWIASGLILDGAAAAVFDWSGMMAAEHALVPGMSGALGWSYPPIFMLYVAPLALVPFLLSYALWIAASFAAMAAVIRKIAPARQTIWLLLGFPATLICAAHGQNSFLTAALFGGALTLMNKRPVVAGVLIGLLAYKPQFGLLIPLALLAGRQWTAFAAAAVTTVVLIAGTAALFGPETWLAFWNNLAVINQKMAEGQVPILKMTSLFATLRVHGVDASIAYALHAVLAAAVAAVVAWVWHRRRATAGSAAVLIVGALLVSPHVYDYDLPVLAVAIALIGWAAYSSEPLPGERAARVLAWLTPMIVLASVTYVGVQLGTVSLLIVFAIAVRRALTQSDTIAPPI